MINIQQIVELHRDLVVRWHEQPIDCPCDGFLGIVCRQASFNFLLWHEEDIARSTNLGDARIAQAKRTIDKYNQQRNDWIEKIDDWITERLAELNVVAPAEALINTETLGSTIDRLSILALRVYHLEEQRDRIDAAREHRALVATKLGMAFVQLAELSRAAQQLADDILCGSKQHKTYRALKMYNDPRLNPYVYRVRHMEKVAMELDSHATGQRIVREAQVLWGRIPGSSRELNMNTRGPADCDGQRIYVSPLGTPQAADLEALLIDFVALARRTQSAAK